MVSGPPQSCDQSDESLTPSLHNGKQINGKVIKQKEAINQQRTLDETLFFHMDFYEEFKNHSPRSGFPLPIDQ